MACFLLQACGDSESKSHPTDPPDAGSGAWGGSASDRSTENTDATVGGSGGTTGCAIRDDCPQLSNLCDCGRKTTIEALPEGVCVIALPAVARSLPTLVVDCVVVERLSLGSAGAGGATENWSWDDSEADSIELSSELCESLPVDARLHVFEDCAGLL